ncbi:MAG: AraC family ligand binding domain-containing protein [Acetatifactor sp.]|nr:AraC family ligand binding domain-containing protein [Acetatifactor sp.]
MKSLLLLYFVIFILSQQTVVYNIRCAGDYFFLPKDKPHIYYPCGELWEVRWTAFEGSICDELLIRFGSTEPIIIKSALIEFHRHSYTDKA